MTTATAPQMNKHGVQVNLLLHEFDSHEDVQQLFSFVSMFLTLIDRY